MQLYFRLPFRNIQRLGGYMRSLVTMIAVLASLAVAQDKASVPTPEEMKAIVGKTLYADANSVMYEEDTADSKMVGDEWVGHLKLKKFERMKPIEIASAEYLPDDKVAVIHLKFLDGGKAKAFGRVDGIGTLFEKIISHASLLSKVPKSLTDEEISAIEHGSFFVGMSEWALYEAMGPPGKTNDYGNGGKQLIYLDGGLLIYVNTEGKIIDRQFIDR